MDNDVVVTRFADTDIYTPGSLPVPGVAVEFMVGKHGPFRAKVEKTGDWDTALKLKIEEEVRRVRSLQA
jgi:hypothetical protein